MTLQVQVTTSLPTVEVSTQTNTVQVQQTPISFDLVAAPVLGNATIRSLFDAVAPLQFDVSTGLFSIDEAAVFAGKDTDDLAEGNINLYFTEQRARDSIGVDAPLEYDANTGIISIDDGALFSGKTTDELAEGNVNLYFTQQRARESLSVSAPLQYDTANGDISIDEGALFSGKDTDDLAEGNVNLYYTDQRVKDLLTAGVDGATFGNSVVIQGDLEVQGNTQQVSVIDLLVQDHEIVLNWGNASARDGLITVDRSGSSFANAQIRWNETADAWEFTNDGSTYLPIPATSTDLAEGTNLYFTQARARESISATANIDYDSNTGVISQSLTTDDVTEGGNLYFTDQRAVDAVEAEPELDLNLVSVSGLQLDTVNPADAATGRIIWNDGDQVPQFQSNGITVDISLEMLARCRNVTGNTIPKGTAVCIVGASSNRISIAPSDRTQPGSACRTLGVTTEDIDHNQFGKVSTFGLVRGLDTSAFADGDELFVGATPGSLTTQEPDAPARRLVVGYVVTSNPSQGQIFVTLRRGVRVREIDDVQIDDLENGDVLQYNQAAGRWENVRVQVGDYDSNDFSIDFGTKTTDDLTEGNANLYYTDTRSRAAISTSDTNIKYDSNTGVLGLSNALVDVNSITAQQNTALTINRVDSQGREILGAQIDNPGWSYTSFGLPRQTLSTWFTKTGAEDLYYFQGTGEVTEGSDIVTINFVQEILSDDDPQPRTVSDIPVGSVLTSGFVGAISSNLRPPEIAVGVILPFDQSPVVLAVDGANNTIQVSQTATRSFVFEFGNPASAPIGFIAAGYDSVNDVSIGLVPEFLITPNTPADVLSFVRVDPVTRYAYPATGFTTEDFDWNVGDANSYVIDSSILSEQMTAKLRLAPTGSIPNFTRGFTVGAETELTTRGLPEAFQSFGLNMTWNGKRDDFPDIHNDDTQPGAPRPVVPQFLFNSFSEGTPSNIPGRLFFQGFNGTTDTPLFDQYPRANQGLGSIQWGGPTQDNYLNVNSITTSAGIRVNAASDWISRGFLAAPGNTDMYLHATTNNDQANDVFVSFEKGELFLAAGNHGELGARPISFGPSRSFNVNPAGTYTDTSTRWATLNYSNTSATTGSEFTISSRGAAGGDLVLALDREESSGNVVVTLQTQFPTLQYLDTGAFGIPTSSIVFGAAIGFPPGLNTGDPVIIDNIPEGDLADLLNGNTYFAEFTNTPTTAVVRLWLDSGLSQPLTTGEPNQGIPGATFEYNVADPVTSRRYSIELDVQSEDLEIYTNGDLHTQFLSNGVLAAQTLQASDVVAADVQASNVAANTISAATSVTSPDVDTNTLTANTLGNGGIVLLGGAFGGIDGGNASQSVFDTIIDGGEANTSQFGDTLDGGSALSTAFSLVDITNFQGILASSSTGLLLNQGAAAGANSGVAVQRANDENAAIQWNESLQQWRFTEDSNVFYPFARDTDDLAEAGNLYFTQQRARESISVLAPLEYDSSNGIINIDDGALFSGKTTDELTEGNVNLYFTTERVRDSISATANITFDSNTGVISQSLTTDDVAEGDNLYFSGKTTDNLPEGSTDLYFTQARARNSVSAAGDLAYDSATGVFSVTTYKSGDFDTDFAAKTTTDLTEGTNLYFTDARTLTAVQQGNVKLKQVSETVNSESDVSGTVQLDLSTGTVFNLALTDDIDLSLINATAGSSATIILTQDSTGGRTLSVSGGTWLFAGGIDTLSTAGNAIDILRVFTDGSAFYAALNKGYV